MIVIGLSGAQGAGKSTLLIELQKRGWILDQFRVSRAVQAQLGWDSLDQVMESVETMQMFQKTVLEQKLKHDFELHQNVAARTIDPKGRIILTERTFADIFAYTSQWTWRFHDQNKISFNESFRCMQAFTAQCVAGQTSCYDGVILLPFMEHVAWEDDANRASKNDVQSVFEDIESFILRKTPLMPKLLITTKTVSERADQVETFLRSL